MRFLYDPTEPMLAPSPPSSLLPSLYVDAIIPPAALFARLFHCVCVQTLRGSLRLQKRRKNTGEYAQIPFHRCRARLVSILNLSRDHPVAWKREIPRLLVGLRFFYRQDFLILREFKLRRTKIVSIEHPQNTYKRFRQESPAL